MSLLLILQHVRTIFTGDVNKVLNYTLQNSYTPLLGPHVRHHHIALTNTGAMTSSYESFACVIRSSRGAKLCLYSMTYTSQNNQNVRYRFSLTHDVCKSYSLPKLLLTCFTDVPPSTTITCYTHAYTAYHDVLHTCLHRLP